VWLESSSSQTFFMSSLLTLKSSSSLSSGSKSWSVLLALGIPMSFFNFCKFPNPFLQINGWRYFQESLMSHLSCEVKVMPSLSFLF